MLETYIWWDPSSHAIVLVNFVVASVCIVIYYVICINAFHVFVCIAYMYYISFMSICLLPMCITCIIVHCLYVTSNSPVYGGNKEYFWIILVFVSTTLLKVAK